MQLNNFQVTRCFTLLFLILLVSIYWMASRASLVNVCQKRFLDFGLVHLRLNFNNLHKFSMNNPTTPFLIFSFLSFLFYTRLWFILSFYKRHKYTCLTALYQCIIIVDVGHLWYLKFHHLAPKNLWHIHFFII